MLDKLIDEFRSHLRALLLALALLVLAMAVEEGTRAWAQYKQVGAVLAENAALKQRLQQVVQQANQTIAQLKQQGGE